ncbi:MAG TPA: hypothetical protein VFN67_10000 [Polyangiales bacterium]|nr:hypothetical protein [Polyangiales bacterium]
MATMIEHTGEVQRDHAGHAGKFEAANDRARFVSGDALRTLDNGTARLQLPASGSVLVQGSTTIRLWRGKKTGVQVNVQTGMASVVAAKEPVSIQTALGLAVLQAGSELRVRPDTRGQRFEIKLGRASLTTAEGQELNFGPGESIGVDEELPPLTPPAVDPQLTGVADAGEPEAAAEAAPAELSDLELQPGASISIYDPAPPSRIRLSIPASCPHGAGARVRGKTIALSQTQALLLSAGRHDYQVSCLDEAGEAKPPEWKGTVRVVKNPGTARLPKSAPRNSIDVDGRSYTVLFQNIAPVLDVQWPGAPKANAFVLIVRSDGGRERRIDLREPRHTFAAGALPEGRHQLSFEAQGASHSRPTTVTLRFDNASPTASLRLPPVAGFAPADHVEVAGIALPGAQVSVLGKRLPLDPQGRFAGDVPVSAAINTLAVRIHHPRTGTRYYVRRVKSSP